MAKDDTKQPIQPNPLVKRVMKSPFHDDGLWPADYIIPSSALTPPPQTPKDEPAINAEPHDEEPNEQRFGRRTFLKRALGLAGGAVVGGGVNALTQTIKPSTHRIQASTANGTPKETPEFSGGAVALTATMGAALGAAVAPELLDA